MSLLDFTELQEEQGEWADKTFGFPGVQRKPEPVLHHLKEEVKEVLAEPYDKEEYADCILLLMDASRLAGFNMDDLYFAVKAKLKKNRTRTWGKPDKNGVVRHI